MNVLLINGSPHQNGCTARALTEVAGALKAEGIGTEIYWIGNAPVRGCIGCWGCKKPGADGCVFKEALYTDVVSRLAAADGLVVGSPVYYAGPNGSLCALLDRLCFSQPKLFRGKPAAATVNCRRSGATAAFARLNSYFTMLQMPVITSQYWNDTHGFTAADQVEQDLEGLQTLRILGRNMAYHLRCREAAEAAGIERPEGERWIGTHFIR